MKELDQLINRAMGKRLQLLRREKRFSISELAVRTGFSRSSLQNYEAGARQPSLAVLTRLSSELGCSPAWLCTFSDALMAEGVGNYHLVNKPVEGLNPATADSVMYSSARLQAMGCMVTQTELIICPDSLLAPDILKGDEVLIDKTKNHVEGSDIFCVRDKSGRRTLKFARREFNRDGITLYTNDDAHFPPVFIEDGSGQVEIVGRVINVTRWR